MNVRTIYVLLSRGFDPWVAAAFATEEEAEEYRAENPGLSCCEVVDVRMYERD